MKQCFIIATLFILLSSCASTFFYSKVSTLDEDMIQTKDGDFVSENDSLLIAYWFNGENTPIYINIYNKSNAPLYVDWTRSSIITGDKSTSYCNNTISIFDGDEEQSTQLSETISFIPPNSRKTFRTYALSNFNYSNLNGYYFKKAKMTNKHGEPKAVKILDFSERSTPLKFRSYITLYRNLNEYFPVEHEFYISKLIKTRELSPKDATGNFITKGDLFYIEKQSKNRGFGEAVFGSTLLLGGLVVNVALSNYDN